MQAVTCKLALFSRQRRPPTHQRVRGVVVNHIAREGSDEHVVPAGEPISREPRPSQL